MTKKSKKTVKKPVAKKPTAKKPTTVKPTTKKKTAELGEVSYRGFLRRMNVSYPWLKFVAGAVMAVAVVAMGFGLASLIHGPKERPQVGEEIGMETEAEQESSEEPGISAEEGSQAEPAEKPAEKTEEKPNETEPTPAKPAATQPATGAGNTGKKLIALTFDDGPSAATTGRLLDILKEKQVKVTFFVLGNMAQRSPDLVRREEAEGHEVGSHTPWHNQQTKLTPANIQAEWTTMEQIFGEILGRAPTLTRPPYGAVNNNVRTYLKQPLILWSIDPEDWKYRDTARVRAMVVGAAQDGAIALMHDIYATTVEAVPGIIDDLRAQGYEFLTVSELAKARGVSLQDGVVYYHFK